MKQRYAAKRDIAEPAIVQALEAAGVQVWPLDFPVDLAVRRQNWPPGMVQLLEVKTPRNKAGAPRLRKKQRTQANFIASTGTPIVTTPIQALRAIGATSETS